VISGRANAPRAGWKSLGLELTSQRENLLLKRSSPIPRLTCSTIPTTLLFPTSSFPFSKLPDQKHGTFVGGQISDVTEIEPGVPSPSIRLDTSGKALLVDPALVTPEPATWSYAVARGS
jgi:hypothetical protein